jgi:plasmid maintenance system antidote protein VapI
VTRLRAYGQWHPWTGAAPVREHVRTLMAAGIGWVRAAELADVSPSTVHHLLYGDPAGGQPPSAQIRPETARRLRAVHPNPANAAGRAYIGASGARRRLQALVTVGHTIRAVAARMDDADESSLTAITRGRPKVSAGMARRIAAIYDQLWSQPPPERTKGERIAAGQARGRAARLGWAPPQAWDDGDDDHLGPHGIDNPDAAPHEWRRPQRKTRPAPELAEDAAEIARTEGIGRDLIAERLGVTRKALDRAIHRAAQHTAAATDDQNQEQETAA